MLYCDFGDLECLADLSCFNEDDTCYNDALACTDASCFYMTLCGLSAFDNFCDEIWECGTDAECAFTYYCALPSVCSKFHVRFDLCGDDPACFGSFFCDVDWSYSDEKCYSYFLCLGDADCLT